MVDTGVADIMLTLRYALGDIFGAIFVLFVVNFLLRTTLS